MNTTTKTRERREKASAYELAAIQSLNSDRARTDYAEISHAPAERTKIVLDALTRCSNGFRLCHLTVKIARACHNPRTTRFAISVNWAMCRIAERVQTKKLSRPATTRAEVAA